MSFSMHRYVRRIIVKRVSYPPPILISANRRVSTSALSTLPAVSCIVSTIEKLPVDDFRREAFIPQEPRLITMSNDPGVNAATHCSIPAARKWFIIKSDGTQTLNIPYLKQFKDVILPYELVSHHAERSIED